MSCYKTSCFAMKEEFIYLHNCATCLDQCNSSTQDVLVFHSRLYILNPISRVFHKLVDKFSQYADTGMSYDASFQRDSWISYPFSFNSIRCNCLFFWNDRKTVILHCSLLLSRKTEPYESFLCMYYCKPSLKSLVWSPCWRATEKYWFNHCFEETPLNVLKRRLP